ncbi:MAG TPA: hypothetical protein VF510_00815, partial [Ktedonobacterales bacterium]
MRRGWVVRMWRELVVALLVAMGLLAMVMPVRAANSHMSSGPTLSIAMQNGTTFTYGANPQPIFTVVLTLATKPAGNASQSVIVTVDNS